jgi:hypothetical protein
MTKHFIHYINRRVFIRKPSKGKEWFATPQKLGEGFESPVYHVTGRKTGAVNQIKEGDTIWLVSELKSPWGKLPPALDAKIVVRKIEPFQNGGKKFIADPALSQWFPMANCNDVLFSLQTETVNNKIHPLISVSKTSKNIGTFLQSIRKLRSANSLISWAEYIQKKPLNFISYRILDGTKCAFKKTSELVNNGEIVFWDRWSLPRRLAERREKTSGKALNTTIMKLLEESASVWGIQSKLYAKEKSYSKKEYEKAIELQKYNPVSCHFVNCTEIVIKT